MMPNTANDEALARQLQVHGEIDGLPDGEEALTLQELATAADFAEFPAWDSKAVPPRGSFASRRFLFSSRNDHHTQRFCSFFACCYFLASSIHFLNISSLLFSNFLGEWPAPSLQL